MKMTIILDKKISENPDIPIRTITRYIAKRTNIREEMVPYHWDIPKNKWDKKRCNCH